MTIWRQSFYRAVSSVWHSAIPLPGRPAPDCISIVCLHGVHTREMEAVCPPPSSSISAASFEANLRAIGRHYRIVSLADAVEMLAGRQPWKPRCAVLTFDDSLKCTTDIAFRILERLGMTATVFVSTAAIATKSPYWWLRVDHLYHRARRPSATITLPTFGSLALTPGDGASLRRVKTALRGSAATARDAAVAALETQLDAALVDPERQFPYAATLTWDDARAALQRGFSVGSHTVTHPNLALLDQPELEWELAESKRTIEAETHQPCRYICYPYGSFNGGVAATAAACGYEAATSTMTPGRNTAAQDRFALRRYAMPSVAPKLEYVLSGFPDFIGTLRGSRRLSADKTESRASLASA